MKITSYHGLVESTSIHCDDSGIHALFTDLVGELKGTRTWMLQVYENWEVGGRFFLLFIISYLHAFFTQIFTFPQG